MCSGKVGTRHKELLTWKEGRITLVFEYTWGGPQGHVYFPSERTWNGKVPSLLRPRYHEILNDVQEDARANDSKVSILDNAWVEVEGR